MNTWTVKLKRASSHLFPLVSSSGFKRLCPPVVNCSSKPTRCPPCLLRRAWLCLNCLCWCESLLERNSITSPLYPVMALPSQAEVWLISEGEERETDRERKREYTAYVYVCVGVCVCVFERNEDRQNTGKYKETVRWRDHLKQEEMYGDKQEIRNIKMHSHENIIWHSPSKQFVLDGGLNDMGVTSQKHDYWKLFGFMRLQIKCHTNGSPCCALGLGLLKESHFLACKSF